MPCTNILKQHEEVILSSLNSKDERDEPKLDYSFTSVYNEEAYLHPLVSINIQEDFFSL